MVKTEMLFKDNWTVLILRFKNRFRVCGASKPLWPLLHSHELIIHGYTLKGNSCCHLARLVAYLDFCKQDVLCSWIPAL